MHDPNYTHEDEAPKQGSRSLNNVSFTEFNLQNFPWEQVITHKDKWK